MKTSSMEAFFSMVTGLMSITTILFKTDSIAEIFPHRFCGIIPFKISENFLQDVFAIHFLTKLQSSNLKRATVIDLLIKILRTYNSNSDLFIQYLFFDANADAKAEISKRAS